VAKGFSLDLHPWVTSSQGQSVMQLIRVQTQSDVLFYSPLIVITDLGPVKTKKSKCLVAI